MHKSGVTIVELILVVFIIFSVGILFVICKNNSSESVPTKKEKTEAVMVEYDSNIESFGLGVYYFPQTGNNFGKSLGLFLSCHTNLEVSAIAGEVTKPNDWWVVTRTDSDYSTTIGYFVTFREKK